MGIQLHLQRLQFGLNQAFFQLGGAELPFTIFAVIIESLAHGDDHPINQQIEMPRLYQQRFEDLLDGGVALPMSHPRAQEHVTQGKQEASSGMDTEAALPGGGLEGKTTGETNHRDRQQRKDVPISQSVIDGLLPADLQAGFGARDVKLAGEGQPQKSPKSKGQEPPAPSLL